MDNLKSLINKGSNTAVKVVDFVKEHPEFVSSIQSIWIENKRAAVQLEYIKSKNEIDILNIAKKYELMRDALVVLFGERQTALNAHYATLDQALNTNDREIILESLRGISTIVAQNPLESFSEFSKIWNDKDETLYLDF